MVAAAKNTYDPNRWCVDFLAPWNDHDIEAVVATFTPDGVWEFTVGSQSWGATHTGHAAIRELLLSIYEAIPDLHYELIRYHAGHDHLTMEVLITGTSNEGKRLNYQACDILTLTDGKVAKKRSYRKVVSYPVRPNNVGVTQPTSPDSPAPSPGAIHPVDAITTPVRELIETQRLCYVATVGSDGQPNLSPKGSLKVLDGRHLVFADIASPQTVANLRVNPRLEINVVDPFLRRGYRIKGTADIRDDPKLLGVTATGLRHQYPVRAAVHITVTDVRPVDSPVYLFTDTSPEQVHAMWEENYGYHSTRPAIGTGS